MFITPVKNALYKIWHACRFLVSPRIASLLVITFFCQLALLWLFNIEKAAILSPLWVLKISIAVILFFIVIIVALISYYYHRNNRNLSLKQVISLLFNPVALSAGALIAVWQYLRETYLLPNALQHYRHSPYLLLKGIYWVLVIMVVVYIVREVARREIFHEVAALFVSQWFLLLFCLYALGYASEGVEFLFKYIISLQEDPSRVMMIIDPIMKFIRYGIMFLQAIIVGVAYADYRKNLQPSQSGARYQS